MSTPSDHPHLTVVATPEPITPARLGDLHSYLTAVAPGEEVFCWVLRDGGAAGRPLQRWGMLQDATALLNAWNAQGRDIYVALNGHLPQPQTQNENYPTRYAAAPVSYHALPKVHMAPRDGASIRRVRVVKLDVDKDGADAVARVLAHAAPPTVTVQTSPGKFQFLWSLDSHVPATENYRVKLLERHLCDLFGGDTACAGDLARVFRVPGFRNRKYPAAPMVTISHQDLSRRYTLDALMTAFGVDASISAAHAAQSRFAANGADLAPPAFTPAQIAWRNAQWEARVLRNPHNFPPLEFNIHKSTERMMRAAYRAADYGFGVDELDTPECLGPWLAAAVVHPATTPNPDAADPAAALRRMYQSCLRSRSEPVGCKVIEEWFRRDLTEWQPTPTPTEDATTHTPTTEDTTPANPAARAVLGTDSGLVAYMMRSYQHMPRIDPRTDVLHVLDPDTGLYKATDKHTVTRFMHSVEGMPVYTPGQKPRPHYWRTHQHRQGFRRVLHEHVQATNPHNPADPYGGVAFSCGTAFWVDTHGVLHTRTPDQPAPTGLGVGMHHLPYPYPTAPTQPTTFLRWLVTLFPDVDVATKVQFIQRWIGLALLGECRRAATALALQGASDTGKSVLLLTLRELIPDAVGLNSPKEAALANIRADIANTRCVIFPDNIDLTDMRALKAIISQDVPVTARRLYQDAFQASYRCGVALSTNADLLINEDPTDGIWRRMSVVPVTRPSLTKGSVKGNIMATWMHELPLIARWALDTVPSTISGGWRIPEPPAVTLARITWQHRGNNFLKWLYHDAGDHLTRYLGDTRNNHNAPTFDHVFRLYKLHCMEDNKVHLSRAWSSFRAINEVTPGSVTNAKCVGWTTRTPQVGTAPVPTASDLSQWLEAPPPQQEARHWLDQQQQPAQHGPTLDAAAALLRDLTTGDHTATTQWETVCAEGQPPLDRPRLYIDELCVALRVPREDLLARLPAGTHVHVHPVAGTPEVTAHAREYVFARQVTGGGAA